MFYETTPYHFCLKPPLHGAIYYNSTTFSRGGPSRVDLYPCSVTLSSTYLALQGSKRSLCSTSQITKPLLVGRSLIPYIFSTKRTFYIAGVSSIELTPFLKVVIVSYTLGRDDSLPRDVYHILVLGKLTPFVKAFIPHMPSTS